MKYYPCNGKRCPIQYNAISSVENCKLFDKCNFYEPRKTPEYESLKKGKTMATIHYRTCDRCGKKLDLVNDYEECYIETPSTYIPVDLCDGCEKELVKMIADFIGRELDE